MIGVFDSGFGGLTVFKEIEKLLPQYDYIYLGDSARAPYGNHSPAVIYGYAKQAVDFLIAQGCQLIIFACNTASADALPKLQIEYQSKIKILGVIRPVIEAVQELGYQRIGVMGTRSTIASKKYVEEAHMIDKNIQVEQLATPLLVPLIEENVQSKPWAKKIIKNYVYNLKSHNLQAVILGCTHYGIIKKQIAQYFGSQVEILDASQIVASKLQDYLERHPEIEKLLVKNRQRLFLTTDDSRRFDKAAGQFLGKSIVSKQVTLY